jgi:hypothetical protein
MEEEIENILNQFYSFNRPDIQDLSVLDESPELGIVCIRWRADDQVITVKSILQGEERILNRLT